MTLRVERSGLLTTVQDLGRPGHAHLGVSASGAADAVALRLGNRLAGNPDGAPALEMTLVGGEFVFETDAEIAIAGADFGARVGPRDLPPWGAYSVRRGERLAFGASRAGARCYLCVRGGFEAPRLLGSASTHVLTGLGGRVLREGDRIGFGTAEARPPLQIDRRRLDDLYAPRPLRVTLGPQHDWFAPEAHARLASADFVVLEQSNRMGIRLAGPALERASERELWTEGVSLGAIQVPRDGQPIVLFVEHQTTGGYPKIANVCSADLHRLGQLRPRDRVRFEPVSFATAQRLLRDLEPVA